MFQFVLIVYFLLGWLGFWAEVYLVQEEIQLSNNGLVAKDVQILRYFFLQISTSFHLGFFSFWLGPTKGKIGHFFKNFFSILHLHILPQGRQVGKVGGW